MTKDGSTAAKLVSRPPAQTYLIAVLHSDQAALNSSQ